MPLAATPMVPKAGALNGSTSHFLNFSEFLGNFKKILENFLEKSSAHYVIIECVIRKRQKLDI